MNWYTAKIIYNISIDNGQHKTQFDEQLRLIEAQTASDAFLKAKLLGKQGEYVFTNEQEQLVQWKMIDVSDVVFVGNKLEHGLEVYTSTHEESNADDYIDFVRQRARIIQAENLIFA